MTVRELIRVLQTLPPDDTVFVLGEDYIATPAEKVVPVPKIGKYEEEGFCSSFEFADTCLTAADSAVVIECSFDDTNERI